MKRCAIDVYLPVNRLATVKVVPLPEVMALMHSGAGEIHRSFASLRMTTRKLISISYAVACR
jgi:hypothetical protein